MGSRETALGRLLRDRREALGYSRARTSELSGVSAGTIESWELGRVGKPPIHDVLRLARAIGISTAELEAAVLAENAPRMADAPPQPAAVPLLEQAIVLLGWSEKDAAAALNTSPDRVRSLRQGEAPLSVLEVMTLTALVAIFREGAGEPTQAEISATLARLRHSRP